MADPRACLDLADRLERGEAHIGILVHEAITLLGGSDNPLRVWKRGHYLQAVKALEGERRPTQVHYYYPPIGMTTVIQRDGIVSTCTGDHAEERARLAALLRLKEEG